MGKEVQEITLNAMPAKLDECFEIMEEAGVEQYALFGGAVRDTDYAAYHGIDRTIKDYDVRVWLPSEEYDQQLLEFVANLGRVTVSPLRIVPAGGTSHVRYCFEFSGTEMDVSIRPRKNGTRLIAATAIDRASDADIGLSAVAIAPDKTIWATPEYLTDRDYCTLTVYPDTNADRLADYTARMMSKYPDHIVVNF